jgi:hypothetical protein
MISNDIKDGEILDLQPKNLGTTELFPSVTYLLK